MRFLSRKRRFHYERCRFDVLDAIESVGSVTGKPTTSVRIIECGRFVQCIVLD